MENVKIYKNENQKIIHVTYELNKNSSKQKQNDAEEKANELMLFFCEKNNIEFINGSGSTFYDFPENTGYDFIMVDFQIFY
jgi:hypothetical protein